MPDATTVLPGKARSPGGAPSRRQRARRRPGSWRSGSALRDEEPDGQRRDRAREGDGLRRRGGGSSGFPYLFNNFPEMSVIWEAAFLAPVVACAVVTQCCFTTSRAFSAALCACTARTVAFATALASASAATGTVGTGSAGAGSAAGAAGSSSAVLIRTVLLDAASGAARWASAGETATAACTRRHSTRIWPS